MRILAVDYSVDFLNAYKHKWRYTDKERSLQKYCQCYDCGAPYHDFEDMVIPNDLWEKINPTEHEGSGILCPTCIVNRLNYLSLWYDILSPLKRIDNLADKTITK